MGRSKAAPKRRRDEDEHTAVRTAASNTIERLLQRHPDVNFAGIVEEAAVDVYRGKIGAWPTLNPSSTGIQGLPESFRGLGRLTLTSSQFQTLETLHETTKRLAQAWVSWSGDTSDTKKRAFGVLPGTLGYTEYQKLDIVTPWVKESEDLETERRANQRALVHLKESDMPPNLESTIGDICNSMKRFVDPVYHPYLRYSHLMAAQPNLHCGRFLLPPHVDHPLKDGFGILIVTIAIRGDADILLESEVTAPVFGKLPLEQGQAYILSGNVRNKCTHGVLAGQPSSQRESLNLRFGLHSTSTVPASEVLQYWDKGDA